MQTTLLDGAGNGDGPSITVPDFGNVVQSHLRTLFVWGTFDSASVAFQISPDDTTWIAVADADSISANSAINVEFRAPFCRCVVSGGSGGSDLNAKLF